LILIVVAIPKRPEQQGLCGGAHRRKARPCNAGGLKV